MSVLYVRESNGKLVPVPSIKGDKGNSGVYVGSGDMPEDCNVQIDPTGTPTTIAEIVALVSAAVKPELKKYIDEQLATK